MKYESNENSVNAVYSDQRSASNNPFIDALPELLNYKIFMKEIESYPKIPLNLEEQSREERRKKVEIIGQLFIPMDYMYSIYDMLFRGIIANYLSYTTLNSVKQMNKLYDDFRNNDKKTENFSTQSFSGSILGVPGIGKTSVIRRCLKLLPQVMIHTKVGKHIAYFKQITYLFVECPIDCSIKTLAYNIILAVDMAIGSQYYDSIYKNNRLSASALAIQVKIICMNHHVGIVIIDEIQNAVTTAVKNRQLNPLIKFLVELTNETYSSICFCGTMSADELFNEYEHLKRRTRGLRLLPMKPDKLYYSFLNELWPYQMTLKKSELNEGIANFMYDHSAGIPSYILKIYMEAQIQAILSGSEKININIMKEVIAMQNIMIHKNYAKGISISSFSYELKDPVNESDCLKEGKNRKKGRPVKTRQEDDLIELYKNSTDFNHLLSTLIKKEVIENQEEL